MGDPRSAGYISVGPLRLGTTVACVGVEPKRLGQYRIVVFIPTLVSRGATFPRPAERYRQLCVAVSDVALWLSQAPHWPERASVVDDDGPFIPLGVSEADGETKVGGRRHELVHGVKLELVVLTPGMPSPKWMPHRWVLKETQTAEVEW